MTSDVFVVITGVLLLFVIVLGFRLFIAKVRHQAFRDGVEAGHRSERRASYMSDD